MTLDGVPENLALGVGLAESGSYALLASLSDSVMPEAYVEGGPLLAIATSGGFPAAYALTTLD